MKLHKTAKENGLRIRVAIPCFGFGSPQKQDLEPATTRNTSHRSAFKAALSEDITLVAPPPLRQPAIERMPFAPKVRFFR